MRAIVKHKTRFTMDQYDDVTSIVYNDTTKNYTITYGNAQTVTYNSATWVLTVITF